MSSIQAREILGDRVSAYCMSKGLIAMAFFARVNFGCVTLHCAAAVSHFVRAIALEYAKFSCRVNSVAVSP